MSERIEIEVETKTIKDVKFIRVSDVMNILTEYITLAKTKETSSCLSEVREGFADFLRD